MSAQSKRIAKHKGINQIIIISTFEGLNRLRKSSLFRLLWLELCYFLVLNIVTFFLVLLFFLSLCSLLLKLQCDIFSVVYWPKSMSAIVYMLSLVYNDL